jgi:response regulator NasT
VAQALVENGYDVVARFPAQSGLAIKLKKVRHDVLVMDIEEVSDNTIAIVSDINSLKIMPFVMFADRSSAQQTGKAISAGVTALVINGFYERRIASVMDVAIARHTYNQQLQEIKQVRHSLLERKLIDRAKGIIMQHRKLTEDDAYKSMRKLAMDRNQKLVDVAKSIIEVSELLI